MRAWNCGMATVGILAAVWAASIVSDVGAAETAASDSGRASTTGDSGSSSRESRRRAIEAMPLEQMPQLQRKTVEKCLQSTTLYRKLPIETFACDSDLLRFSLEKPEAIVDIWRVLGISRLALDPAGPNQWRLSDGYGTVGVLRLLHREKNGSGGAMVLYGRGAYSGSLSPKALTGTCLLLVQYRVASPSVDGKPRQSVQIDAFLDTDGVGLEIVARTLQPIIVRSAASNLHEICLFMSSLSQSAQNNPEGVGHLADRLTRTDPEDRQSLAEIARAAAAAIHPQREPDPSAAARLQADLAARWLPAEELDHLYRQ